MVKFKNKNIISIVNSFQTCYEFFISCLYNIYVLRTTIRLILLIYIDISFFLLLLDSCKKYIQLSFFLMFTSFFSKFILYKYYRRMLIHFHLLINTIYKDFIIIIIKILWKYDSSNRMLHLSKYLTHVTTSVIFFQKQPVHEKKIS